MIEAKSSPLPQGEIWAVLPVREGVLSTVSLETLEEARRNADALSLTVRAVILAGPESVEQVIGEVERYGADAVAVLSGERAVAAPVVAEALAERVVTRAPAAVLFAGNARGIDLGARVAAKLRRRFADRCVRVDVGRQSGVTAVRSIHGGRKHAEERWERGPFLAAMLPGVVGVGPGIADASPLSRENWALPAGQREDVVPVASLLGDPRDQDLRECDVIVSVGRGLGSADNLGMIRELAAALSAGVGGSRPAIEAGWLPYERQVGQTGKTVSPRLYLACGISGATQHLAGIQGAETVISINSDASAPLGGRADLAITGDLHEIVPQLIAAIGALKAQQAAAHRSAG